MTADLPRLSDYTLPNGERRREVFVTTRSGERIHAQGEGSSVTRCGHWQKANAHYFTVRPEDVNPATLCESCFGDGYGNARPSVKARKAASAERGQARRQAAAERAAEKAAKKLERDHALALKADALILTVSSREEAFSAWCSATKDTTAWTVAMEVWRERDPR